MSGNRKRQVPLFFAAAIFLVGGLDALLNHDYLVGIPSLCAGVLNLAASRFIRSRPRATTLALHLVNATVAAMMAIAAELADKQYIQYAWWAAVFFFILAAFLSWRADRGTTTKD